MENRKRPSRVKNVKAVSIALSSAYPGLCGLLWRFGSCEAVYVSQQVQVYARINLYDPV